VIFKALHIMRLLRRKEAAIYVLTHWGMPLSYRTLAKLAVTGGGPAYRKAGKFPLYEAHDLDEWVQGRLGPKVKSTTEQQSLPRLA
jgi:hypothetical protein